MNPLEMMKARLEELRKESQTLLDQRSALVDNSVAEKRGLTADEQTRSDSLKSAAAAVLGQIPAVEERVAELTEQERRNGVASDARKDVKETSDTSVKSPEVYARGNRTQSFFRDLGHASINGDRDALERLHRHSAFQQQESRALGNTNATGGSGGEFAPPAWWIDQYIKALRPKRPIADLLHHAEVPDGYSSINIPKILTGTTTALQSTQNTALSQTDMTTGFVTTGFSTVAGKQVVSQQMIDQAGNAFDQVVGMDLAADYVRAVDFNVINGAGVGANDNSVVNGLASVTPPAANIITFTSGSPTAALLYAKCAQLLASFATNRFDEPTHWLMHPRRWYSIVAAADSQGRPLIVPDAILGNSKLAFNPLGENSGSPVEVTGIVGYWLGLPVVIDPLLPITYGAGTNQDRVYLIKADDLWLFESAPKAEVFRDTYADSLGILYRIYGYLGTILNRQPYSIGYVDGTGLVTPTFASTVL